MEYESGSQSKEGDSSLGDVCSINDACSGFISILNSEIVFVSPFIILI